MLDREHRVTARDQPAESLEQAAHVARVKSGRGLVEHEERSAGGGRPDAEKGRQSQALRLSPESVAVGCPRRI